METGSGREMGAFSSSGKDIPVALTSLQLCFPRRGQALLPGSEPRDGRKERMQAHQSASEEMPLTGAACAGGQHAACVVSYPGIRGGEGRNRLVSEAEDEGKGKGAGAETAPPLTN